MIRGIGARGAALLALLSFSAAPPAAARQNADVKPPADAKPQAVAPAAAPAANPADVASADAILAAVYDVISGPAGKKRDWNRMRSLFAPGARLIAAGKRPSGEVVHRMMDVEGYVNTSGPFIETNGFFEREVARRTDVYGNIAHVFSTYEARNKADDPKPFMRGINSIQLFNDGKRWWVMTIYWQAEGPDNPLPAKYLTSVKE